MNSAAASAEVSRDTAMVAPSMLADECGMAATAGKREDGARRTGRRAGPLSRAVVVFRVRPGALGDGAALADGFLGCFGVPGADQRGDAARQDALDGGDVWRS